MKNLIKVFGIVAILVIIGFSMVSCKEDENETVVTYINKASVEVTVVMEVGKGWTPASFTLGAKTGKQEVKTTELVSEVKSSYVPADKVKFTWDGDTYTYTFSDK